MAPDHIIAAVKKGRSSEVISDTPQDLSSTQWTSTGEIKRCPWRKCQPDFTGQASFFTSDWAASGDVVDSPRYGLMTKGTGLRMLSK
jgi:hypothetical protein